jgi:hypothetical protein
MVDVMRASVRIRTKSECGVERKVVEQESGGGQAF